MPTISTFFGILIRMYYKEHGPPHFHAHYGSDSASYEIRTLQLMSGSLPPRAQNLVLEWAEKHRNQLLENWELASARMPLKNIEPLE
jgi:hypothetical protein